MVLTGCPRCGTRLSCPRTSSRVGGVVSTVHTVHGHHTRVGIPPSEGTGICITAGFTSAFESNARFVRGLTSTDRIRITRDFRVSNTMGVMATSTGVCVPVSRLISERGRLTELGGRLRRIGGHLTRDRNGLGGRNFITGTPRTMVRGIGKRTTGRERRVTLVRTTVTTLGWFNGPVGRGGVVVGN